MNLNNFIKEITAEMIKSVNNNYSDNYDRYRFGEQMTPERKYSLKEKFVKKLNDKNFFNNVHNLRFADQLTENDFPFSDFLYLYEHLEDEFSKALLIKIITYRIMGHTKVKLPLSTPEFWKNQEWIESYQNKDNFVSIDFMDFKLPYTDLKFLDLPIKMYYSALGINIDFIIKQYELHRTDVNIIAEPGDIVIDAGGCFGDTALYFANLVGKDGQVKVFEFIPDNIKIFNKNIQLNPGLAPVIELVEQPLWEESGKKIFFEDNGPASKVSLDYFKEHTGQCDTITIDDYVNRADLKQIDLIKMDIEGAEIHALEGAKDTLKKYKPKLAIALYHSTKDFESIPRFIHELGLGYKFYLSHATIYGEETMLFAIS